ncbi:hypothetical protein ACOMHN_012354 [Nucella lapillus]
MSKRAAKRSLSPSSSTPTSTSTSVTGKQPKMTLYGYDWDRAVKYQMDKKEQHKRELKNARQTLKDMYKERKERSKEDKKKATFHQWFMQYADVNFPDLGKVTYCVPHFYIGNVPLKQIGDTGAYDFKQESDLRGENAQRKVVRAFTLLSHRLEEGGDAMFIMTNVLYENVLKQAKDAERDMGGTSSDILNVFVFTHILNVFVFTHILNVFVFSSVFKFVPEKKDRKESDVMILHEQKGVILVQVKSVGTHRGGQTADDKKNDVSKQLKNDEQNFRKIMDINDQDVEVHKVAALPNLTATQVEEHCTIDEYKEECQQQSGYQGNTGISTPVQGRMSATVWLSRKHRHLYTITRKNVSNSLVVKETPASLHHNKEEDRNT